MLNIESIEHAAPGVAVVVAFDDIFAAVVEIAVAEQEAETAELQIFLVVALMALETTAKPTLSTGRCQRVPA